MFCARCGQQIPDASEICPLCGRDANIQLAAPSGVASDAAAPAVASALAETPPSRPIRRDLQGVGGWLLFFCIGMVVLSPLVTFVQVINGANNEVLVMLLEFPRVTIGVVAGIFLWNVRPVAFTLLWIYFGIVTMFAVLGIIGFAAKPDPANPQDLLLTVRSLIYVFVWFLYFRRSERVRATFGRNL